MDRALELPRDPAPITVDFETRYARDPTDETLVHEGTFWERVQEWIEPGEKKFAFTRIEIAFPTNPAMPPHVRAGGWAYLTDRKMIAELSIDGPRDWVEFPHSHFVTFGPSKLHPPFLQLITIERDGGTPPVGSVYIEAHPAIGFWDWCATYLALIEKDGGAHVRPEFRELLAAEVAKNRR
jgi:hypothetical protein